MSRPKNCNAPTKECLFNETSKYYRANQAAVSIGDSSLKLMSAMLDSDTFDEGVFSALEMINDNAALISSEIFKQSECYKSCTKKCTGG